MSERSEAARIRRRTLIGALCAGAGATLLRRRVHGQARMLPLENLGLEHLDIVVPDTAESARFYKRVFSSPLHEQDFRGGKRYFVLLGDLPPDRQVGYIAIGAANGRPIGVGHYCALAEAADLGGIGRELAAAGYPAPGGGFGMIPDPEGLELQLFVPPCTAKASRRAMPRYPSASGSSSPAIRASASSRSPTGRSRSSCGSASKSRRSTALPSRRFCEPPAPRS
jgi:catechol 2,3-dioxygenase-like lactoylglutathione lyase family enzyme